MIIDVQQYSAFSFLPMVALALVSILQSIFLVVYPVPATGTRFRWIAYRLSAINNLLAPKPTPKLLALTLTLTLLVPKRRRLRIKVFIF